MSSTNPSAQKASSISASQAQLQKVLQASQNEITQAIQVEIKESALECAEQALFNPLAILKRATTLEERKRTRLEQSSDEKAEEDQERELIQEVGKIAEQFQDRNPELQKRALTNLKSLLSDKDTPEEILHKVLQSYPDHFIADEAFDFLLRTTDPNSTLGTNIRAAKDLLNERYNREIRAGRNINEQAREFSKQGIGTAGSLRDLYRDVTANPREPVTLFEELSEAFSFEKMKVVLQFMLHSVGSDLKSKGPSISSAELQRLFGEVRTMQAILGIYRFFHQRMRLIEIHFGREGVLLPKELHFELLAKLFVKLISEKYPSPDKVLNLAKPLNLVGEILGQVIIFTQFRDALRGTSPKLFKSDKHRQDLLMTLIDTISELDDLLEEEEEEDEEKQKEDERKRREKERHQDKEI